MIIKKLLTFVTAVTIKPLVLVTSLVIGLSSFIGTRIWMESQSFSAPRSYVVKIQSVSGHGSGVLIAPGLALTAFHVTGPEGKDLMVNGKPIQVLKYDQILDISLIKVDATCPCAPLGTLPEEDTRIVTVGYPLDAGQFATEGHMQGIHLERIRMLVSSPITFGNSGGGVFAFQGGQWRLVGVAVETAGANLGFFGVPVFHLVGAVSITNIMEFIHDRRG